MKTISKIAWRRDCNNEWIKSWWVNVLEEEHSRKLVAEAVEVPPKQPIRGVSRKLYDCDTLSTLGGYRSRGGCGGVVALTGYDGGDLFRSKRFETLLVMLSRPPLRLTRAHDF